MLHRLEWKDRTSVISQFLIFLSEATYRHPYFLRSRQTKVHVEQTSCFMPWNVRSIRLNWRVGQENEGSLQQRECEITMNARLQLDLDVKVQL